MITDADLAAQQERLHESIASLTAKVMRLRASHEALLAAAKLALPVMEDEFGIFREDSEQMVALVALRAAIKQGERV